MRDIEFKAISIDSGMWVYGSYTCMEEDNKNNPFRQTPYKKYHRIWQYEPGDWNMGGYADYEVIPETVCEFTGFRDKDKEKIFEGDKLYYCVSEKFSARSLTGIVKYKEGCFYFEIIGSNSFIPLCQLRDYRVLDEYILKYAKIVGNIHDKIK